MKIFTVIGLYDNGQTFADTNMGGSNRRVVVSRRVRSTISFLTLFSAHHWRAG
jgi:hypothetical protein